MRWVVWTRERLWLVPLAATVLAVDIGLGFIALDRIVSRFAEFPFLVSSSVRASDVGLRPSTSWD